MHPKLVYAMNVRRGGGGPLLKSMTICGTYMLNNRYVKIVQVLSSFMFTTH